MNAEICNTYSFQNVSKWDLSKRKWNIRKEKKYSNVCFQNQEHKNFKNWLTNMQLQWTCSEDSCEKSFAGADRLRRLIKTIHEVQRYQM